MPYLNYTVFSNCLFDLLITEVTFQIQLSQFVFSKIRVYFLCKDNFESCWPLKLNFSQLNTYQKTFFCLCVLRHACVWACTWVCVPLCEDFLRMSNVLLYPSTPYSLRQVIFLNLELTVVVCPPPPLQLGQQTWAVFLFPFLTVLWSHVCGPAFYVTCVMWT